MVLTRSDRARAQMELEDLSVCLENEKTHALGWTKQARLSTIQRKINLAKLLGDSEELSKAEREYKEEMVELEYKDQLHRLARELFPPASAAKEAAESERTKNLYWEMD
jgi:hypothetical protein